MNEYSYQLSAEDIKKMTVPASKIGVWKQPELSNWTCYLFGGDKDFAIIQWTPLKGRVPNCFVRWMMKLCFGCTWVKKK